MSMHTVKQAVEHRSRNWSINAYVTAPTRHQYRLMGATLMQGDLDEGPILQLICPVLESLLHFPWSRRRSISA